MKHQNKTKQILVATALVLGAFTANAQMYGAPVDNSAQPPDGRAPDAAPVLMPAEQFQPQQDNPNYTNRDDSNQAGYDRTKEQPEPPPTN